jgi:hypothetical protein
VSYNGRAVGEQEIKARLNQDATIYNLRRKKPYLRGWAQWKRRWAEPMTLFTFFLALFTGLLVLVGALQLQTLEKTDEALKITKEVNLNDVMQHPAATEIPFGAKYSFKPHLCIARDHHAKLPAATIKPIGSAGEYLAGGARGARPRFG